MSIRIKTSLKINKEAERKENILSRLPETEESKFAKSTEITEKERKYLPSCNVISLDGKIEKEKESEFLIIDQNTYVYKNEKVASYLDDRGEVVKKINPVYEDKIDKLNIKSYIEK